MLTEYKVGFKIEGLDHCQRPDPAELCSEEGPRPKRLLDREHLTALIKFIETLDSWDREAQLRTAGAPQEDEQRDECSIGLAKAQVMRTKRRKSFGNLCTLGGGCAKRTGKSIPDCRTGMPTAPVRELDRGMATAGALVKGVNWITVRPGKPSRRRARNEKEVA